MQASKLIIISTAAVLMGGTSLAVGHALQSGESQHGASTQAPAAMSQGNARGSMMRGSNAQVAAHGLKVQGSRQYEPGQAMTMQRGRALNQKGASQHAASTQTPAATSQGNARGFVMRGSNAQAGEQGSKLQGSRQYERGQAMIMQRGRALAGERDQGLSPQRGRAATGEQPPLASHARQSVGQKAPGGPVYGGATASEARVSLTPEQRARLREMARRELPRASYVPELRVNAVVPRNVQLAPVPGELARYYPRFRRNQAFLVSQKIVVVDPVTSRIVAILPA